MNYGSVRSVHGNSRNVVDANEYNYNDNHNRNNNAIGVDVSSDNADDNFNKEVSSEWSELCYKSFAALGRHSVLLFSSSNFSIHDGVEGMYSSLSRAAFHIFKGNVGAGVFLLASFYENTGYLLGAFCVLLLGVLMIDCALVLLEAKHVIDKPDINTYPAVVEYFLGRWMRRFTEYGLIFTQFGFCVVYIQYSSSLFAELFHFPHVYELTVLLSVCVVTPMTFLSDRLSLLASASVLAGICVGVVLAGTIYTEVYDLAIHGVHEDVRAVMPSASLFVFLSGHMFSLEGIGVVLPVENSISPRERPQFATVLKNTLTFIVFLYCAFGVLGYVAYGTSLTTSVVLALQESTLKCFLQCLLGVSLILGYPIQYVPAIQIVDKAFHIKSRINNANIHVNAKAYGVRIALNVFFGVIAVSIGADTIDVLTSFIGAFAGVHLMITIPSLLALQIDHGFINDKSDKYHELSESQQQQQQHEEKHYGDFKSRTHKEHLHDVCNIESDNSGSREKFSKQRSCCHCNLFRQCCMWYRRWRRVKWMCYLVFAWCVWLGGIYYTFMPLLTREPFVPPPPSLEESLNLTESLLSPLTTETPNVNYQNIIDN